MNQIIEVKLSLVGREHWVVTLTKAFAPENGGGTQTFVRDGGIHEHYALDVAREMVTVTPGRRTDLGDDAEIGRWLDPTN